MAKYYTTPEEQAKVVMKALDKSAKKATKIKIGRISFSEEGRVNRGGKH